MIRNFILPAVLVSALAAPAFASDYGSSGSVELNEENRAKIDLMLTEQGYEVAKVKLDDGKYEAYARKGGERYEIYIDAAFKIMKIERDD